MAARLSALRAGPFLPPGRFLVFISVRGCVDPRSIVRLEGLGDLPACSIVPQPTTLPRAHFQTAVTCILPSKQVTTLHTHAGQAQNFYAYPSLWRFEKETGCNSFQTQL
jgi:hypothetical protein